MFRRWAVLLAGLVLCGAGGAQTLTIVYGDSYKPFAWGQGREAYGVQRDFVQRVLGDKLGLTLIHEMYPWKRAQVYVRDGAKDGFFTVPTEERTEYTEASALPFYETHFVMHTARSNPHLDALRNVHSLQDLETLPELRHIHMLGSGWHEAALKNMAQVNRIVDAGKIPSMLAGQRADVYIEQAEMFRFQAAEAGLLPQLVTLREPSLRKVGWHLFLSKKSPHVGLMSRINEALRQMQASGELERIKLDVFKKNGVEP